MKTKTKNIIKLVGAIMLIVGVVLLIGRSAMPTPPFPAGPPIIIAILGFFVALYGLIVPGEKPESSPESAGDGINDAVDKEIKEIADDIEKSAKEGYTNRTEYYSPDPAQSAGEFTRIVLTNIMGKPIKAVISRDDVSGVLKVVMNGVDPKVFEPSLSAISDCVSETIKTGPSGTDGINALPMNIYNCTNDYFSKNGKEFEDEIVPAAFNMYKNAFNVYAPQKVKDESDPDDLPKFVACELDLADENPEYNSMGDCVKAAQTPKITWDKLKEFMVNRRNKEKEAIRKEEEAIRKEREKELAERPPAAGPDVAGTRRGR